MFANLPRPTIFAHRGASAHAPENTLAAFRLAVQHAADGIELDAKLTSDRQVVVIHDPTVDRTTGQRGSVAKLTLGEIRRLDAGSHYDPSFRGELIPTLGEVFESIGNKIWVNIELTNYTTPFDDLPWLVAEQVRLHHMSGRVIFSSFSPIALWRIHRLLPGEPIALLAYPGWRGAWARARLGSLLRTHALHIERSEATPSLLEALHRRGCRVHVYTVNQAEDMRSLFLYGVDGIFTDDPALARQVLLEQHPTGQYP